MSGPLNASLAGQRVVVTGGSSGIGRAFHRILLYLEGADAAPVTLLAICPGGAAQ